MATSAAKPVASEAAPPTVRAYLGEIKALTRFQGNSFSL